MNEMGETMNRIGDKMDEPKQSGLGIASFVLSIFCGFLVFAIIMIAGYLEMSRPEGIDDKSPEAFIVGFSIILAMGMTVVAFGLGLAALFQRNRRMSLAVLGMFFSSMIIVGTVLLSIIGNAAD